jgi:hypothetical protein|tara:strand:- start:56 stop:421 length:366 start_codon:yes stop_codon:yes gene_type:complete
MSKEATKERSSPGQIDRTSAKEGSSFLPRAARMSSRSASITTSLCTMMSQSSRQSGILFVPPRPLVLHRAVFLVPLTAFSMKAIAVLSEKVILLSFPFGMPQIDAPWSQTVAVQRDQMANG